MNENVGSMNVLRRGLDHLRVGILIEGRNISLKMRSI